MVEIPKITKSKFRAAITSVFHRFSIQFCSTAFHKITRSDDKKSRCWVVNLFSAIYKLLSSVVLQTTIGSSYLLIIDSKFTVRFKYPPKFFDLLFSESIVLVKLTSGMNSMPICFAKFTPKPNIPPKLTFL